MSRTFTASDSKNGLTFKAYQGDGAFLLAFSLDDNETNDLAGFAIKRTTPDGKTVMLLNRISFDSQLTSESTAKDRTWTPSDEAPFQKFWWTDFPPNAEPGKYKYEVTAMRFGNNGIKPDQKAYVELDYDSSTHSDFEIGFTRGYIQSQAYANRFKNEPFAPVGRGVDFDTKPYEDQYQWLGYHARKMIFNMLDECRRDNDVLVDVLVYDCDEPDFIRALASMGNRVRILMDDAALHHSSAKQIREDLAEKVLLEAGCSVRRGNFSRYAHDKVIIKRKSGQSGAVEVLTGSTNFSVTGLYVNANHVLSIKNSDVATLYGKMFDLVFNSHANTNTWKQSALSNKEFEFSLEGIPNLFVSLSPHINANTSLSRVETAIKSANSSVLFAVMAMDEKATGNVIPALRSISSNPDIFSYGITDTDFSKDASVRVTTPNSPPGGRLVQSNFLSKNVPQPFVKEMSVGLAHRIHHKFVVADFNDVNPVVFCGSSNLAKGGEEQNGDNLLAIYDARVATTFAIEAIRLVDHYAFRAAMQVASKTDPLRLKNKSDVPWWNRYYVAGSMKNTERKLFVK